MIKHLGSKRLLAPAILDVVASLSEVRTVVDFFSGTSRVGHALKRAGHRVVANDWMTYAHVLARCYVQADAGRVAGEEATTTPCALFGGLDLFGVDGGSDDAGEE